MTRPDNFAPTGADGNITCEQFFAARSTTLESLRQALAGDLDQFQLRVWLPGRYRSRYCTRSGSDVGDGSIH